MTLVFTNGWVMHVYDAIPQITDINVNKLRNPSMAYFTSVCDWAPGSSAHPSWPQSHRFSVSIREYKRFLQVRQFFIKVKQQHVYVQHTHEYAILAVLELHKISSFQ